MDAIFIAILGDHRERVKELLRANVELATCLNGKARLYESNIFHWLYVKDTPLHLAAAGYRVEIARTLLAAGANANAASNGRQSSPLHYAADGCLSSPFWNARRQVAMIRLLLESGARIDGQDKNGATPLHRAVRTRCAAAVKCFLDAGADPTIRNKPGSTPFHLAVQTTGRGGSGTEKARTAQREILRSFLERGVSPTLKDARGKSVLEWTRSDGIRQILSGNAV